MHSPNEMNSKKGISFLAVNSWHRRCSRLILSIFIQKKQEKVLIPAPASTGLIQRFSMKSAPPSAVSDLKYLPPPLSSPPPTANSSPTATISPTPKPVTTKTVKSSWTPCSDRYFYMINLTKQTIQQVVTDLISLPMPTIAAVSGHASAAGMILALSHDYVLMRKDRGFLYMSELDIKLVLPPWFIAILKAKIASPAARRELVMKAAKVTAEQAVVLGIVDSAHGDADETLKAAVELGEGLVKRGWDGHVYAQNRTQLLADVLDSIGDTRTGSRL